MPKISVIMGIYNTKKKEYLEKSLKSILDQTYNDFEFIICDDGSTNDCIKWVKEIIKNDKRVVLIKNDRNRGLAYTLNHCLEVARGEYIARMDDDDISRLDRFEIQINYLENNDVDLVSNNIRIFDENGIYNRRTFPEHISKEDFLFNSPIVHPTVMAKKNAFKEVCGYRDIDKTIRVEDYDLFMRMFAIGIKMDSIQEELLDYRDDRDNTKRRKKYKYRINEFKVRIDGFKKLKLMPIGIIYAIKPLIVGLLPVCIITSIKKKTNKKNIRSNKNYL